MVRPGKASAAGFGNDPFFAGGSGSSGGSGGGRGGGKSRGGSKSVRGGSSSRASNGAAGAVTERAPKRSRHAGDPAKPGSKLAKRREEGLEVHSDDDDAQVTLSCILSLALGHVKLHLILFVVMFCEPACR